MITSIEAGMKVDIRDENYQWREGIVIRIITRVGEKHKFLKIRYLVFLLINTEIKPPVRSKIR